MTSNLKSSTVCTRIFPISFIFRRSGVFGLSLLLACSPFFFSRVTAQVTPFTVNADADGFAGWTQVLEGGTSQGDFIGASGTGMDVNGNSWGLRANDTEGNSGISRIYEFGNVLAENQYVEISVSIGFITDIMVVGFGLQNESGTTRFESFYRGGGRGPSGEGDSVNAWKFNDAGPTERNITGPSTTFADTTWQINNDNFATFRFTQLANDTYSLSVNGTSITNLDLNLAASDIDRIRIFNWNAGEGENFNQYFNNLTVIPEPSSLALMVLAIVAGAFFRKRLR